MVSKPKRPEFKRATRKESLLKRLFGGMFKTVAHTTAVFTIFGAVLSAVVSFQGVRMTIAASTPSQKTEVAAVNPQEPQLRGERARSEATVGPPDRSEGEWYTATPGYGNPQPGAQGNPQPGTLPGDKGAAAPAQPQRNADGSSYKSGGWDTGSLGSKPGRSTRRGITYDYNYVQIESGWGGTTVDSSKTAKIES